MASIPNSKTQLSANHTSDKLFTHHLYLPITLQTSYLHTIYSCQSHFRQAITHYL